MCGIFGCIGQTKSINTLVQGLKSLEYRGYDSSGLAYIDKKNNIEIIKREGKISNLEKSVKKRNTFQVGIAHTRWATHGGATEINAHPHISYDKNFCLVHNGIVENYQELKNKYLKNIEINTDTDTEIVVHLMSVLYNNNNNITKTLQKVCSLIKGSYAFAVISKHEPDKIYLAKKNSPLLFGTSKDGYYFSSDVNTLTNFCDNYVVMEENQFACLEKQKITLFSQNLQEISKKFTNFEQQSDNKKNVKCYMEQEIAESPTALKATLDAFEQQFKKIPKSFFTEVEQIFLVACGTAYHSCLIGKVYLKQCFSIPILVEIASEFIYSNPRITKKTLCVFVSQSGETADTILSLKLAKQKTNKILSITNNACSTITFESERSIIMQAGWEKAVASTKAYVCQIEVFYLLSKYLQNQEKTANKNINTLVETIKKFNYNKWAKNIAKVLPNYSKIMFIGRQMDYITAMEGSLKLKEITYINSIACPSGELKHGTLALVDENALVIAILTEFDLMEKNLSTLKEISARDGNLLVLSPFEESVKNPTLFSNLLLPQVNKELYPIISIIPLQKLASEISQNFGYNPDMPKNLSKSVTVE